MITHLHITDFILIERLDWDLEGGFTALTGETGAGKSIIIGAIQMILGERAESRKMIRPGASKAVIEATLSTGDRGDLREIFEEEELDFDEECCTLRRELLQSGKSRAFVNDTPVTVTQMRRIGDRLVDIHSQHHNRLIGDADFQRSVIDTLADNAPLREQYGEEYRRYRSLTEELKAEEERVQNARREEDYVTFQYRQLADAHLTPGEEPELRERLTLAEHATEISQLMQALAAMDEERDGREGLLTTLRALAEDCRGFADTMAAAGDFGERLRGVCIELEDIASEASRRLDDIEIDPEALAELQGRMNLLQSLMYKHNVADADELIALRDRYRAQLDEISTGDDRIRELRAEVDKAHTQAKETAARLTESRHGGAKEFVPELMALLEELGIAGASFEVSIAPTSELTPTGADALTFLIATNKQTTLLPIDEIASGGEISRIMLALKAIIAERQILPTVIFDEIDTGVSGRTAERLGRIMKRLSRRIQVIAITHLPQIAAMADHQVVVEKVEEGDGFTTLLRPVEGEERIDALAAMLSGSVRSEAALDNARSLLRTGQE